MYVALGDGEHNVTAGCDGRVLATIVDDAARDDAGEPDNEVQGVVVLDVVMVAWWLIRETAKA